MRVLSTFGGEGLPTVRGVDVTALVALHVSNATVAALYGSVLQGLSPGTVRVRAAPRRIGTPCSAPSSTLGWPPWPSSAPGSTCIHVGR